MPILSLASMTGQGGVLAGKEAGGRYRRSSRRPPSPMRLGAASETRRFQEPAFFDQQAMNEAQYTGPGELAPIIVDVGGGNGNPGQIGAGLANAPRIGDPMDLMPTGVEQAGKPAFGQGKFGQFLVDNSDAFLGFAAGALGSNQPGAFGRGFAGFQAGSQMDAERRDREARVKALDEAFASLEAEGKMTPAHRALAAQYPELGAKYAFEMMAPQSQADRPRAEGPDGVLRYIDTGEPVFPGVEAPPEVADFDDEAKLRGEFVKASNDFVSIRDAYSRVQAASQDETGASDVALVYGFMKMLDPGSVVREGEFATAENTSGVPAQIMNLYNKIVEGDRLPPEARAAMVQQAGRQYQSAEARHAQLEAQYRNLAPQYGADPNRTVLDMRGGVQMPNQAGIGADVPPGVDPADWQFMTPEERALFR